MRFTKTNTLIRFLFPKLIWNIPNQDKKIYLTFDDGPIPEITPWVLSVLKKENIKATFFCIGDNIQKHPKVFKEIISEGHAIGNHTYNHLKGWKTNTETYIENVCLCESEIKKQYGFKNKLFRPPFGKIKPLQAKKLREKGYKIIMWDVLTYDFDNKYNAEDCFLKTIQNTKSGSVIVYHDSIKASENLKATLQKVIQELKGKGFIFEKIS